MTALSSIAESIFDEEFYWKEELKDTRYSSGQEEREKERGCWQERQRERDTERSERNKLRK